MTLFSNIRSDAYSIYGSDGEKYQIYGQNWQTGYINLLQIGYGVSVRTNTCAWPTVILEHVYLCVDVRVGVGLGVCVMSRLMFCYYHCRGQPRLYLLACMTNIWSGRDWNSSDESNGRGTTNWIMFTNTQSGRVWCPIDSKLDCGYKLPVGWNLVPGLLDHDPGSRSGVKKVGYIFSSK